jgi:murein DD-endopeptidase MepM/ murein hydrolase activator NlpD
MASATAVALLLQACGREEPRTVVLDPATMQPPAAPTARLPAAQAEVAPLAAVTSAQGAPADAAAVPSSNGLALLAARPLIVPVEGVGPHALLDTYDQGRGNRSHEAIDIMAPRGTKVFAVDDGTLVKLFQSVPGGLTAYHFDPQGQLAYYYAHLDRYAPGLKEGMALRRGDLIGYVGSTGNASPEAPHLHFAVFRLGPERQWWKGTPINPYNALRSVASAK